MEGLSALLKKAEERGFIHGISVTRTTPKVSHLLFADDSIVFMRASVQESNELKRILQEYERASGHRLTLRNQLSYSVLILQGILRTLSWQIWGYLKFLRRINILVYL